MAGLYLHIPFCEQKCIYCDFYSVDDRQSMDEFLAALHREIETRPQFCAGEEILSVYFGGGTPSLLSPHAVSSLLEHLNASFNVRHDAEITLEANPGTTDRASLRGFHEAGINRLSLGIQSFHDGDLRFLSRIHSSGDAVEAIREAKSAGFDNISIDLIYALPGQSLDDWRDNLERGIATGSVHISAYSLIIEQGTPLQRMVKAGTVSPAPADTEAEMYEMTMAFLRDADFEHYEVSNYARPGFRSVHNSNYWNHTPYLGFGPSAHSFWNGRRWWNVSSIQPYCRKLLAGESPVSGSEILSPVQLRDEAIMLGLRSSGINVPGFSLRHGIDLLSAGGGEVEILLREHLAVIDGKYLRLTDRGFLLCDEIGGRLVSRLNS